MIHTVPLFGRFTDNDKTGARKDKINHMQDTTITNLSPPNHYEKTKPPLPGLLAAIAVAVAAAAVGVGEAGGYTVIRSAELG